MDAKGIVGGQLSMNGNLIDKMLDGLSEEDFLAQLPGGGQNAAWVVGHLAVSEDHLVKVLSGGELQIAAELHEKFKGGSTVSGKAGDYPSKDELIALFKTQRGRTLETLENADLSTWDNPAPDPMSKFFPTLGNVWGMIASHSFWHTGHLTAIRRMLGKSGVLGF